MASKEVGRIVIGDAVFSDDGRYRYKLTRWWGAEQTPRHMVFLLLNPSTATETEDDPTVAKCQRYAHREKYNAVTILNLFAYRSTDPRALYTVADPVGPENDDYIRETLASPNIGPLLCAWGNHGSLDKRSDQVRAMLRMLPAQVKVFGFTKQGEPRHPLYLPATNSMEVWNVR